MAARNTLHVEVVTAERELYNGEADLVSAPGAAGRLGILPSHAPLLTVLAPGALEIKLNGAEEPIFVSGGFLEVFENVVTVLADSAEHAEEIDQARAEEARRRARERLEQVASQQERADLLGALERATSRLRVVELARSRSTRRVRMPGNEP
jgi:F-type H+-transporting ATPase subunit epsilon